MGGTLAVADSQYGNFLELNPAGTGFGFHKEPMFEWHEHPMTSEQADTNGACRWLGAGVRQVVVERGAITNADLRLRIEFGLECVTINLADGQNRRFAGF